VLSDVGLSLSGKPSGVTISAMPTWWQSPGLSRLRLDWRRLSASRSMSVAKSMLVGLYGSIPDFAPKSAPHRQSWATVGRGRLLRDGSPTFTLREH
jgi:hypothetical protein